MVVADVDERALADVASLVHGVAIRTDVSQENQIQHLVEYTQEKLGPIDLFCSNAGIGLDGGPEVPDSGWARILNINVMAHIWASRAVLPAMLERGDGYFLQTVSAAGLLSQIGSAPYSVTKHAALAFAEWLSITYGERGIKVSALCPQGVRTNMLLNSHEGGSFLLDGALEPAQVADAALAGIEAEQFLILPHPEVKEYFQRKASDYDRWLRGMRRLQARVYGAAAAKES